MVCNPIDVLCLIQRSVPSTRNYNSRAKSIIRHNHSRKHALRDFRFRDNGTIQDNFRVCPEFPPSPVCVKCLMHLYICSVAIGSIESTAAKYSLMIVDQGIIPSGAVFVSNIS